MPEPVYSNIGKLLLSTQIYDMHRMAHEVYGGLIVALPCPDEDHNPAADENRAISRNKQPGRCCDAGCNQPGQPVMVPLPTTGKQS